MARGRVGVGETRLLVAMRNAIDLLPCNDNYAHVHMLFIHVHVCCGGSTQATGCSVVVSDVKGKGEEARDIILILYMFLYNMYTYTYTIYIILYSFRLYVQYNTQFIIIYIYNNNK